MPSIIWFRDDLRLADNPALTAACTHDQVIPIYIHDTSNIVPSDGSAANVWRFHSLMALNADLEHRLQFFVGDPRQILPQLCADWDVQCVYANTAHTPEGQALDRDITKQLQTQSVDVQLSLGHLLWDPTHVTKDDGTPYKVFTPYYRKGCLLHVDAPRKPLPRPRNIPLAAPPSTLACPLTADPFFSSSATWPSTLMHTWTVGEQAALTQLKSFLSHGIEHYKDGRNFPAKPYTSRLSAYLKHGEITPHIIWVAFT